MDYDRLPLIGDSTAEFLKLLSISVLQCGVIAVGMVICGDSEVEYIWSKNTLVRFSFL